MTEIEIAVTFLTHMHGALMETEEYNDIHVVRFLESKSDKQRSWPRGVEESKDKEAKRAYRQTSESFATYDGLLFKLKRRKKPETGALASTRATGARLRDDTGW